jgi:hypothetical protein
MQSMISTDPMIALGTWVYETSKAMSGVARLCATWIKTRPRNDVRHERFSTSFAPEQMSQAQGFFTVSAFIAQLYTQLLTGAAIISKKMAIYWPYGIRTSEGMRYA